MATVTTKETGGRAPLMTIASFSPPECAIQPEELDAFLPGSGLNGRFKYEEFGAETDEHIRIFEELIATCGGEPGYVSPTARMTEAIDGKIHEAAILMPDGADEAIGAARNAFQAAIDQVEQQEDEHIRWARETWEKLIVTQARLPGR